MIVRIFNNLLIIPGNDFRKPKPAEISSASFGIVPRVNSAVEGNHNDNTNAIRSLRCAAVKELKLFLAVVA